MTASLIQGKASARKAQHSTVVEALARLGLASRGLVYVVVGLLAFDVALGHHDQADRNGALGAIKDQPFGGTLLVVLAIGFAGYAAWRLLEAAVGHTDADGAKRVAKRLGSLGRAVVYVSFAVSTVRFLQGSGQHDKTKPVTARVMAMTGGQLLVGLAGLVVIGAGLYTAYRGFAKKFLKRLDLASTSGTTRTVVERTGQGGLIGRGLVFCLIGGFLVQAAWTFDAAKAKGLDAALKTLAQQAFGPVLLGAAAIGLLVFGLWSFVEARFRTV